MALNKEIQVVVFRLADQTYALEITAVREIIYMEEITGIPRSPEFIEGVIKLRGQVIPVVDLGKRFGLEASSRTAQSRIIIMQVNGVTFGLIVDAVHEVLSISADNIAPPPPMIGGVDASFIKGIALLGERLIILLDETGIFYADEQQQLQQVEAELNE